MTPIAEGLWLVKDIGWIQLPVCGQGNVKIIARVDGQEHTGQLKNVLFVPSLNANLISIGTATYAGVVIVFTENKAIFNCKDKVTMVVKRSGKGLYHLNVIVKTDDPLAVAAAARTKISLNIALKVGPFELSGYTEIDQNESS